jgi:hypothetical protein
VTPKQPFYDAGSHLSRPKQSTKTDRRCKIESSRLQENQKVHHYDRTDPGGNRQNRSEQ